MTTPEQDISAKRDASERFDNLFYSKSDEKFIVRGLLDEILQGRKLEDTLDIGPGAGHVSEPLASRSKRITMVEKSPQYKAVLTQRFENARVISGSIADVELDGRFDLIWFSHVLYYHPQSQWMPLMKKLHALLKPGGELILALNADSGDWWKILCQWTELKEHMGFDYIPLSVFRKEIAALGAVKVHPYRYQMWIDGTSSWSEFIGKQILELKSEEIYGQYEQKFCEFTAPFKQIDGSFVLDMRAEMVRISAAN